MQSTDYKFHRYKFDLVIDATSKHNLAAMAFNATDIKSFQYVLIVRAGLAVSERREMSKSEIEREVFIEFTEAVARCAIPSNLNGMNSALLLRSKNFLRQTCLDADLHTGDSLWRKFAEIKKIICNDFTDLYVKFLPGGQPPSGLSLEDVLEKTRVAVFERYELKKNKDSINKCPPTWLPTEWLAFVTYGKPSASPQDIFNIG